MLARAITDHPEVQSFSWSKDAELDAALLLSGNQPAPITLTASDRCCFQTTYLNEQGIEYLDHRNQFHLIWLIRNPYSVVYSMLYNWKRFALNEVFLGCGLSLMPVDRQNQFKRFGLLTVKPIDRACYAWLGKATQCSMLLNELPVSTMTTIGYEDLVQNKAALLTKLFDFAELSRLQNTDSDISSRSMKKSAGLSKKERSRVTDLCELTYAEHMDSAIRLRA